MTPLAKNMFNWDVNWDINCDLVLWEDTILTEGLLLHWEDTNERIKAILEDISEVKPPVLVCYWEGKAQIVCVSSPLQKLTRMHSKKKLNKLKTARYNKEIWRSPLTSLKVICPTQSKACPVIHAVGGVRKCSGQLQGRYSSKSTCTAVLISRLFYSWVIEHFPVTTQLWALCSILVSHSIPYNPFTTYITISKSEQKMERLKLSK